MDQIKPPETLSLPEQISRFLAEAIMAGQFQPGESITEKMVSELFRVSRAPVREAFRILERDGVLQIVPRHGARVTVLHYDEMLDALEVRAILFGAAAGHFARASDDDALDQFAEQLTLLETMISVDDAGVSYNQHSATLTALIMGKCDNKRIREMFHQLDFQVGRYRRLGLESTEMRRESYTYWQQLLDVCRHSNADAAERIGRAMIARTREAAAASFERS